MLGEPFGAAKARDVGLVTEVVAEAELLAVATAAAEKLAEKPPGALKSSNSSSARADTADRGGARRGVQTISRTAPLARGERGVHGVLRKAEAGFLEVRLKE